MIKAQRIFSVIGFFCIFLYFIYVGGSSTSKILKYLLVIGLLFLTIDLIFYIITKLKFKKIILIMVKSSALSNLDLVNSPLLFRNVDETPYREFLYVTFTIFFILLLGRPILQNKI